MVTTTSRQSSGTQASRLVVIGQGYVGLPLAMRAVAAGFDVVGYETNKNKVSMLADAESYVDDIDGDELADALSTGRYEPTDSQERLEGFDVAVVAVPTPLLAGIPDTSCIESAVQTLGKYLKRDALVILESTTYPGTTEELVAPILEAESGLAAGRDFLLGYSPERIDPGNTVWTFERTPKVVSGMDERSLTAVKDFYGELVDEVVPVKGTREAELTKLVENTFRHVNIALINELAIHAKSLQIDIWDVIEAAKSKPFGFMPFYPGPGVGGHCLPVDPTFLSWRFERQLGTSSRFVKVANDVNDHMPDYVVKRIQTALNDRKKPVNGSRVLVLGVAYKANSNDSRETPATGVIEGLIALGAEVQVYDSHIGSYELDDSVDRLSELTETNVAAADAIVLLTDHADVDYDLIVKHGEYIFDSRHRLTGAQVEYL